MSSGGNSRVVSPLRDGHAVGSVARESVSRAEWVVRAYGGVHAGRVLPGEGYRDQGEEHQL